MKKLILTSNLSPGDILMLTAAIRDLHECYPNRFLTDVRTYYPEIWEHNKYITPLKETDPDVQVIECKCPLIHAANHAPFHYLHAFSEFLNETLGLRIKPTAYKGHIQFSQEEISEHIEYDNASLSTVPFWILVAGGKRDYTIKWWDQKRFQDVVNSFHGKIQFVQVGASADYHPKISGTIDLRGKTNLRTLLRLVYHSQGIVCPVTMLMHLAAAIEYKYDHRAGRPCVVVAGGREPPNWESYPHHQFIHTVGALHCCRRGGCWKSRTVALGDGDAMDAADKLCLDVVGQLPRCMDMITSEHVTERIRMYFSSGWLRYLDVSN